MPSVKYMHVRRAAAASSPSPPSVVSASAEPRKCAVNRKAAPDAGEGWTVEEAARPRRAESQAEVLRVASRKRAADQLLDAQEDTSCVAIAKKPGVESAPARKKMMKKKNKSARAPLDWRAQRIVRDLGRLDVLRRGDVGPDVVSDDEDESALDILVRKLVEDADEDGHMAVPIDDDYDDNFISGNDDDDDHPGGAMDVDGVDDEAIMPPPPPNNARVDDAESIAVVTYNGDESIAGVAGDGGCNDETVPVDEAASASRIHATDVVDLVCDDEDESPSAEDTASKQTPVADLDEEILPTDVNYNHGARNPLNDPTAQPVYQPGDENTLGPLRSLVRRQIEWFAASSKDVADQKKRSSRPIVLGQVGFRCVHCAHMPYTIRGAFAVLYPKSYRDITNILNSYKREHLMQCKETPSNVKTFYETLSSRPGKKRAKQRERHVINKAFQSIGIIEEDGRLFYEKSDASVILDRRDVIGSDGSEEGYWLCDKCQSVKFAKFDEACRHEETCCGTAAKPDSSGLDQSGQLLHKPDASDSTEQGEGAYVLSLCCECNEVEDPSSDVPMLLCDGCDSATHLTCTKDTPKLVEVPEGEWYCSNCALVNRFKEKRLSEDRAITAAFTAVDAVLEDNFYTAPIEGTKKRPSPMLGNELGDIFEAIPEIQSKLQPGKRRVRYCVVMGCKRIGGTATRQYMCCAHFTRGHLLQKIHTMPNGERRFPCNNKNPSLHQDHDRAYVAVPPNAKHGTLVKCSNAVCRSLGSKYLTLGEKHKYCAVCDNIFERLNFEKHVNIHKNELAVRDEQRTQVDTAYQAPDEVNAEDGEIVYGFDSIRGHTKDKRRKGKYLFRVQWKNGEITSEPDTYLKEDDPATFVAYLQRSGLSKTKQYAWANEEEHV